MDGIFNNPHNMYYILGIFIGVSILYVVIKKLIPVVYVLKTKSIKIKRDSTLDQKQLLAIACGANLSNQNRIFLNALETGAPKQTIYNFLNNNWGLSTKQGIIETLERLYTDSQYELFNYISEICRNVQPQERYSKLQQVLTAENRTEEEKDMVFCLFSLVEQGLEKMRSDNVLNNIIIANVDAYNISRGINLARWACQLKYINENEAWSYITKMADKMFHLYGSWEELSVSYIMGRIIFSNRIDEFYETQLECHKDLLSNPESPWLKLKWPEVN